MRKHLRKGLSVVAAFVSTVVFAGISVILNFFGGDFPIEEVHFLRPFISALLLFPFILLTEPHMLRPNGKDIKDYVLIGFFLAVSIVTFNIAMTSAPIGTMAFLGNSSIFMVAILSFLLLKEKFTRKEFFAILIALIGVGIINPLEPINAFGATMIFISAFTFAFVIVLIRKEEHTHSIGIVFWYLLFASTFLFPLAMMTDFVNLDKYLKLVFLLGVLNGMGYLLKTYALKYLTADLTQVIALICNPLSVLLLGFIVLRQPITMNVVIGGFIIILSGILVSREFRIAFHH